MEQQPRKQRNVDEENNAITINTITEWQHTQQQIDYIENWLYRTQLRKSNNNL